MKQKTLVIRPGALGDTLMLLPALKDLGIRLPTTIAGREPGISFLKKAGFRCINMEGGGWHRLFQEQPDTHKGLSVPLQDRVVAYVTDSDGRIARNLRTYFPGTRVYVFPAYPAPADKIHVARHVCMTLAQTGLPADPDAAMETARNRALLRGTSAPSSENLIVIHPGSGSSRKNFPPTFWTVFLRRISEEAVFGNMKKTLILLGPAEEDLRDFFGRRGSGSPEIAFCPRDEDLVALLEKACLYVGHDSGITHLAAMHGTPTLAVFREDNLSMWQPLGPFTRAVYSLRPDTACLEKVIAAARILEQGAGS